MIFIRFDIVDFAVALYSCEDDSCKRWANISQKKIEIEQLSFEKKKFKKSKINGGPILCEKNKQLIYVPDSKEKEKQKLF